MVEKYLGEIEDKKESRTPKKYVALMQNPGTWGDLLCLLEARFVIRRRIINLYIQKLANGNYIIPDKHIPDVDLIDPASIIIAFFQSHYYPVRVVNDMKHDCLVLNSSAGRKYEVGFVLADGNCLFRSLVLACYWAQVRWETVVTVKNDVLQVDGVEFVPQESVMKMSKELKEREYLYLGFKLLEFDYLILTIDRKSKNSHIFSLDECMSQCVAMGKYVISKSEASSFETELQSILNSLTPRLLAANVRYEFIPEDEGAFEYMTVLK